MGTITEWDVRERSAGLLLRASSSSPSPPAEMPAIVGREKIDRSHRFHLQGLPPKLVRAQMKSPEANVGSPSSSQPIHQNQLPLPLLVRLHQAAAQDPSRSPKNRCETLLLGRCLFNRAPSQKRVQQILRSLRPKRESSASGLLNECEVPLQNQCSEFRSVLSFYEARRLRRRFALRGLLRHGATKNAVTERPTPHNRCPMRPNVPIRVNQQKNRHIEPAEFSYKNR